MTSEIEQPTDLDQPAEAEPRLEVSRPSLSARIATFWFGPADTLPLDAFRILLGLALIWNYVDLLPDAGLLYSDSGILPRASALLYLRESRFSLLDMVGTPWLATAFLLAGIAVSAALTIGYRTRLAAIASFVMVVSVQERNPLVLDGADTVFRVLLFWMMFAPIGRSWSVDALHARIDGTPLPRSGPAFFFRILQLQIASIYVINYWNKSLGTRWANGSALHIALHLEDVLVRDLGTFLADYEWFTLVGTYGTLLFEGTFIVLLFFPIFQPALRGLGLLLGVGFHATIAVLMKVGWFSILMPTTYLLLCEPSWIEAAARAMKRRLGTRWDRIAGTFERLVNKLPHQPVKSDRPPLLPPRVSRIGSALFRTAMFCMFALSLWYATPPPYGPALPYHAAYAVELVGLHQTWDMFAPEPLDHEGRLSIKGVLENGQEIDLLKAGYGQGGFNPTRYYYDGWYYSRWFKVAERIASPDWNAYRLDYGRSICRAYNDNLVEGAPRLKTFKIAWVHRPVVFPEQERPEWEETVFWEHLCYE